MITVVDYRAGNGPSVSYALEKLGLPALLTGDPDAVGSAERIILPGVGAARATIDSLAESGLVEPLTRRVHADGVPFLGICIGLQVLFEHSEEGDTDCLGWIPGRVVRFPESVRVPQIGWNAVRFTRPHPLTGDLPANGHFYFVNSFHCVPTDDADVLGVTEYAGEFCSVVARDNLAATQFHAEKSGPLGLQILERFAVWEPR
ncbi:MAG: imidazole glycerol phosphate synthase subunit HisH [Acidimicrobiia bacterium]